MSTYLLHTIIKRLPLILSVVALTVIVMGAVAPTEAYAGLEWVDKNDSGGLAGKIYRAIKDTLLNR